jgi:molecular chaperone GrpE
MTRKHRDSKKQRSGAATREPGPADPREEALEAHDVPTDTDDDFPDAPDDETEARTDADAERAALQADLDEQRERYLRLAAEYDNYRKRTDRERAESGVRAQVHLVERLLDVVDDLQRVSGLDAEKATAESVLEGVRLVERKMVRALEGAGLEVVDAEGQRFDPEVHEAIAMVATEEADEDDLVSDVFQKGYAFKGTLVRPARVRVKRYDA